MLEPTQSDRRHVTSCEDHFSKRALEYARHRPQYPDELFAYLASIAPGRRLAWDCGTGNGQAALGVARHFDRVVATDASADQLSQALPSENIEYRVERAEDISLEPSSVDLVTVGIAVHWFDLDVFYRAVRRVAATDGVLGVWTYDQSVIAPAIDPVLAHYYGHVLAGYWPERIRYVAEHYRTLPFPFDELAAPQFEMRADWSLDQLLGYLSSWSAAQRYEAERGEDPLDLILPELTAAWGDSGQPRPIHWPLYLRVGRVH